MALGRQADAEPRLDALADVRGELHDVGGGGTAPDPVQQTTSGAADAIRETGAHKVFVTHGYTAPFRRWLEEQGYDAGIVATDYAGEEVFAQDEAPRDIIDEDAEAPSQTPEESRPEDAA